MKYDKLVRDRIPEIIYLKGEKAKIHVADEKEYWQKLKEKLFEEVKEFDKSENFEEIADILEVIDAICDYKLFDMKEIQLFKQKKAKEVGQFKKMIILEES